MTTELPKRGLSARSRGKRCAKCGYRTIPGNRLVVYDADDRIIAVICMVCLEKILGVSPE